MPARQYISTYPGPVRLSRSALRNLAIVQVDYAYTGVMEISTGIIDLCGAAGTNPHYTTRTPLHHQTFPQYVEGRRVDPIVHGGTGSGNTSHQILARCVIESPASVATEEGDFCGFTIRFNAKPHAEFSGTSRSLKSGDPRFHNGELEEVLRHRIMCCLTPILNLYGWTDFRYAAPRTDPDAAQRARGGAVAAAGLFAAIKRRGVP
jgi:hypothetical protein